MDSNKGKKMMDMETAKAFAINQFEQLHPRPTWPEWFNRCSVLSMSKDEAGRFVVSISLTHKGDKSGFSVFRVAVDRHTAATEVLIDEDFPKFDGSQLEGFDAGEPE